MIEEYIKEENEMTEIERLNATIKELTANIEELKADYAAMLRLHNTTAAAARSEECAQRLEMRQMSEAERQHLARRTGLLEEMMD